MTTNAQLRNDIRSTLDVLTGKELVAAMEIFMATANSRTLADVCWKLERRIKYTSMMEVIHGEHFSEMNIG